MDRRSKPKREPVIIQDKAWVTTSELVVTGVDPGFASNGIAVLKKFPGVLPTVVLGRIIETKKAEKKARSHLRVSADDLRRYTECHAGMENIYRQFNPHAMGIEVYQPGFKSRKKGGEEQFKGSTAGQVKSLAVYGGFVFWALTHGMFVAPFLPSDVKKRFCGKVAASKEEVIHEMCKLVIGLRELLESVPKTKREHIADAAGCAFLVLEEIDKMKIMLGVR